jgi:polysaccharide export outer membrane protein
MTKTFKLSVILLSAIILSSCGKRLIYFQEKENSKNKYSNIEIAKPESPGDHIIQAGDVLGFKFNTISSELANELKTAASADGYLINENGTLFLPYAGSLSISGLTIKESEAFIKKELEKYIVNPQLEVTLNSFRVTILGEVKIPGIKMSPGDRMTIIDALSLAGDIDIDGKRNNIKVIRQAGDKKAVTFIDMSSVDVFKSDAYYLKSNDIIYVESLPKKAFKENLIYISFATTLINTFLIIANLLK